MKKLLCALFLLLFLVCSGCGFSSAPGQSNSEKRKEAAPPAAEIRAVWLSYFELTQPQGTTEEDFRARYEEVFARIAALGLNTVFVHVRPFADAVYPSKLFPWSAILTGTQGADPGYDPLGILLELGKTHGLALHAWINPFRASKNSALAALAADHPILAHINAKDGWVREIDGRYYWNPALPEVHAIIYAGVREVLERYPALAGIHIDDYFYPSQAPEIDRAQYDAYAQSGGALALGDWRRALMSEFVAGLYRTVKRTRPEAILSVSPSSNIKKDFDSMFADVERWLGEPGFADWMIPQVYFGFAHESHPFRETAEEWAALKRSGAVRLLFGLAAYKTGAEDAYAGSGYAEWREHSDILARQLRHIRTLEGYSGFALYSYQGVLGDGLSPIALKEKENLQKLVV
ncbi:MAG: family 10 glycosylhydrolase [Oscillospiraceae bacterium]|nr:family 10 glycosylhydrolase [Oscillospiraceae bacterium]